MQADRKGICQHRLVKAHPVRNREQLGFVPAIIGGIGLLRRKPWRRYLVLVLSVLDLFNIPLGTAVGIYCIWALTQEETAQLFAEGSGL